VTTRHRIAVQNPCRSRRVPERGQIEHWASLALTGAARAARAGNPKGGAAEITVRLVSRAEATDLNRRFRGRDYSPNVLAFPYPADDGVNGDIAICPAIVAIEARAQGKPFEAHLAHLVVHGVLHLCGYDHAEPREAARMERLESRLVAALGLDDPWAAERAPRATMRPGRVPVTE